MRQSFKLALKSIWSSKMRSALTMLGMIIGVASVIILVSVMEGVTLSISDSFTDLGTNQVSVSVTNTTTRRVEPETMYQFLEDNSTIFENMSPTVTVQATLKNENSSITTTTITGVGEGYADIQTLQLAFGRFIQYSDLLSRQKVCVIGSYIDSELYGGGGKALGNTIKISAEAYTIVGILEELSESESGSSDDCAYLPYTSAIKLSRSADITNYVFSTQTTDQVESSKTLIKNYLYEIFKNEDLYQVSSLSEILEMVESMTGMLATALVGIAAISLLVAGIGIMNIMLVSVTERTREIGIRKSLGAKRQDILQQFVIEALVTSSLGGIIGIILGTITTLIVKNLSELNTTPSITAILISFGVSAAIGILFGFMPANRAAKLNPIDALRSE